MGEPGIIDAIIRIADSFDRLVTLAEEYTLAMGLPTRDEEPREED